MPGHKQKSNRGAATYRIRIMSSIVAAQLLCLALVLFWPIPEKEEVFQDVTETTEEAVVQAPVRTQQQSSPPPPPAPQVPVPVPNDEVIEEEEIDFTEEAFADSYDSLSTTAGEAPAQGQNQIVSNPTIGPRVIRIVEPPLKKGENSYEIAVEFLVDKEGNVEEAVIMSIYTLDDEGNQLEKVTNIEDRIVEEVIKAALNWKFRPAQNNGEPVRAYTKNYFTI